MANVGKDTGKTVKQTGRTVFKTDEGEDVSEKSTTFEYKGKWINIPTIHGNKQYSQNELINMLDKGIIEPTSTHDKLEEAVSEAIKRSDSLRFNKGGTAMDKEMEMFDKEGGLYDEGGEVDKESGNDVPIGSTKEEVRDDIPAMLSEGEFVLPADVVRFHGLEKIMQLRQEAKMGLKKMEAMGQMGNSEEATMPDDLPFSMDDLLVVVTGEEEEPEKKNEGGVIHAQQGVFVSPNQPQSNTGIMGYQESMYANQPVTGQPVTPPFMPIISPPSPVPTPPPVGGYTAPTVLAEQVDRPEFVPDVSDQYKSVKYINPTSGSTMMINEYLGNPVSAVPAGFVRYDEYIAGGGKDPSEDDVTGSATGTGVETTQVSGGGSSDDEKQADKKLFDTLKTNAESNRVEKFNTLLAEGSTDDILAAYKEAKTGQGIAMALPGIGIPASLLARKNVKNIEAAYIKRAEAEGIDPETAKKNLEEIGILSSAKDTIGGFGKGIKDTFFKEGGLDNYNKTYDAKYSLQDFSRLSGGNFNPVQGYVKGATGNNLSSIQQQQFDNAIGNGNMAIAKHFEMIARSNDARDDFAKDNAKLIKDAQGGSETAIEELKKIAGSGTKYNGVSIGVSSIETIVEYGGSVVSAVDDGRAEAGGTFKKAKVVNKVGVSGDKGSIKTVVNTKKSNDNNSGGGKSFHEKIQDKAAERRKQAISSVKKTSGSYKTLKETGGGDRGMAKGGLMEKDK